MTQVCLITKCLQLEILPSMMATPGKTLQCCQLVGLLICYLSCWFLWFKVWLQTTWHNVVQCRMEYQVPEMQILFSLQLFAFFLPFKQITNKYYWNSEESNTIFKRAIEVGRISISIKHAGSYAASLDEKYFKNDIQKCIAAHLHPTPRVFNTIDFTVWKARERTSQTYVLWGEIIEWGVKKWAD